MFKSSRFVLRFQLLRHTRRFSGLSIDEVLILMQNPSKSFSIENSNIPDQEPHVPKEELSLIKSIRASFSQNFQLGRVEEAFSDAQSYLSKVSQYYPRNHPAVLSAQNNLAIIFKNNGNHQEALALYSVILAGYFNLLGLEHPSTLIVLQNTARLLKDMKQYSQSLKCLEILSKNQAGPIAELIQVAILQSSNHRELGEFKEAETYLNKAMSLMSSDEEAKNNPGLKATILNNMGLLFKRQERFIEAEMNYIEALSLRKQISDEKHPEVLAIKHNLGELYVKMEKSEEAAQYFSEVLEALKEVDGK